MSLLSSLTARTSSLFHSASRSQLILTAAAIATGIPLLSYLRTDYNAWYSLGQGGAPRNPLGYLLIKFLGLTAASSDLYSTGVYDAMIEKKGYEAQSFFEEPLQRREGARPRISRWVAPVRQLSQGAAEGVREALTTSISTLATSPSISASISARGSDLEGGNHGSNALHLRRAERAEGGQSDSHRILATRAPTEIYHFHPSDGSVHAILSATDAKSVLEMGWGERHPLSGAAAGGIPVTYVMVYAPRTVEEVRVLEGVARASLGYALGRKVGAEGTKGKKGPEGEIDSSYVMGEGKDEGTKEEIDGSYVMGEGKDIGESGYVMGDEGDARKGEEVIEGPMLKGMEDTGEKVQLFS